MTLKYYNGWIILSAIVTDGENTWLETLKYMGFSKQEAKQKFHEYIKSKNWKIT